MYYHSRNQGMTLIEIIIYITLLSILMISFLQYAITLHVDDIYLINKIQNAYQK